MKAAEMVELARQAAADGDMVAEGNWLIHAKRLGFHQARARLAELKLDLETRVAGGDMPAAALLGGILLDEGNELGRALELFKTSAAAGVPEGARGAGFMLTNGIGAAKDSVQANQYFRMAAADGDGYAAYNLAMNIYHGDGAGKEPQEFYRWLRVAAESGVPEASALYGDILASQDRPADALYWYLESAKSGHGKAMLIAGQWYRDGIGTGRDYVQAVRWFLTMLDRGNGDGIHEAIQLAPSMSTDEIREAGRLSGHTDDAELLIAQR